MVCSPQTQGCECPPPNEVRIAPQINQAADKAGDQRRLDENASKVASLKKCTVADLAKKGGLRAMNLDVSFEMMQLCPLRKSVHLQVDCAHSRDKTRLSPCAGFLALLIFVTSPDAAAHG